MSLKILLGLFLRNLNLHCFQGINPTCEMLALLNNMNKEHTSLNYDRMNTPTVTLLKGNEMVWECYCRYSVTPVKDIP